MIEARVPQDIRKFKTKTVGPFTTRQAVCGGIAAFADIMLYICLFNPMQVSMTTALYIMIAVDIPVFIFAFDVQGMPMEKFIMSILIRYLRTPTKRKMVHEIHRLEKIKQTDKEKKIRKKELKRLFKEHPEMHPYE